MPPAETARQTIHSMTIPGSPKTSRAPSANRVAMKNSEHSPGSSRMIPPMIRMAVSAGLGGAGAPIVGSRAGSLMAQLAQTASRPVPDEEDADDRDREADGPHEQRDLEIGIARGQPHHVFRRDHLGREEDSAQARQQQHAADTDHGDAERRDARTRLAHDATCPVTLARIASRMKSEGV